MGTAWFRKKEASKSVGAPGMEYDSIVDNLIIMMIIIIIIIRLKKTRRKFDSRPLTFSSKFYSKQDTSKARVARSV